MRRLDRHELIRRADLDIDRHSKIRFIFLGETRPENEVYVELRPCVIDLPTVSLQFIDCLLLIYFMAAMVSSLKMDFRTALLLLSAAFLLHLAR